MDNLDTHGGKRRPERFLNGKGTAGARASDVRVAQDINCYARVQREGRSKLLYKIMEVDINCDSTMQSLFILRNV